MASWHKMLEIEIGKQRLKLRRSGSNKSFHLLAIIPRQLDHSTDSLVHSTGFSSLGRLHSLGAIYIPLFDLLVSIEELTH
jgi:hypothetical protein